MFAASEHVPLSAANPTRIALARRRRGLTMSALAESCGVSAKTVTAWEHGTGSPSDEALRRLESAVAFPRDFFFGPDLEEVPLEGASFRSLSTMTARQRDRALSAGALAFALSDWIADRFTLPPARVPDLPGRDPEVAAEMVRAAWGLGYEPIGNVVHLLEAHGVWVFSLAEETANVDAFSVWRGEEPYVFLNTQKSGEHSRLDAAHELGHLVLHRGHGGPRGRECEREAQRFGAALLMPRDGLLATVPARPSLNQLIDLKKPWRVSVAALLYRLNALGALSEWQARQLWIDLSKSGYRRREPEGIPQETSQLLSKVLKALRAEGIARADVARQLGIYGVDLSALMFGLVLGSADGRKVASAVGDSRMLEPKAFEPLRRVK